MSDRREAVAPESNAGRTARVLQTVLVFALLGPLLGGALPFALYGIFGAVASAQPDVDTVLFFGLAVYGLSVSYYVGVVPAAVSGLAIGALDVRGGTPAVIALTIGLLVGLVWGHGLNGTIDLSSIRAAVIAAGCTIGTLACWALTRRGARPFRRDLAR